MFTAFFLLAVEISCSVEFTKIARFAYARFSFLVKRLILSCGHYVTQCPDYIKDLII